jgi:hypothetical protein
MYLLQFIATFILFSSALCDDPKWFPLPQGVFTNISAKGDELWAMNESNQIFRLQSDKWQLIPNTVSDGEMNGTPVFIAAARDGCSWMLTNTTTLYRWDVNKQHWENIKLPSVKGTVYCTAVDALTRDVAIVAIMVHSDDYYTTVFNRSGDGWEPMQTLKTTLQNCPSTGVGSIAIGENDNRYLIDKHNSLKHWNLTIDKWEQSSGSGGGDFDPDTVHAVNLNRLLCTTIDKPNIDMHVWTGKEWIGIGKVIAIAAAINTKNVYYVDSITGAIYGAEIP